VEREGREWKESGGEEEGVVVGGRRREGEWNRHGRSLSRAKPL